MHSRPELAREFRALGIQTGDTVMLHASVRAVGEIAGGPDQIHLALKDVLTPAGTLMMYAGCPRYYDEVGRGNLTPDQEREVLDKLPAFDAATARAERDHGVLVEFLRTFPGSRVNQHVARFVVWGRHAEHLTSEGPWNYALGAGSALERLAKLNGRILLLGCDHDTVTFLHYAEHVVDIPNKRIARYHVPVEEHGLRAWRDQEEFDSSGGAHANWPDRFFAKITDGYLAREENGGAQVGAARAYVLSAAGLLEFALPLMQAVAADARAAERLGDQAPDRAGK
jgi:aminoglycoside 3-N-acetyltransferase